MRVLQSTGGRGASVGFAKMSRDVGGFEVRSCPTAQVEVDFGIICSLERMEMHAGCYVYGIGCKRDVLCIFVSVVIHGLETV